MNSFTIKPKHLPSTDTHLSSYLAELFKAGSGNFDQLRYEIQREYRFSGSPDISGMHFDRTKFDPVTGKGSFRVVLSMSFTFGCEDVRVDKEDQTSEWTFTVDQYAGVINFYGSPFIDSRSTADEF